MSSSPLAPPSSLKPKQLPFYAQFTAGAMAGVFELLCLYPLDVVKTRMQLQTKTIIPGQDRYNGMVDAFRKIIASEGPGRLYRGLGPPLALEAPKRATKFAANDGWGKFFRKQFGQEKMTQGLSVLTGASAGATEALVTVPFELVKIRLQDQAQSHLYKGPMDVVAKVVKADGIFGLYAGIEPTLWRHILWNAGYFGSIFQIKALLPKPTDKTGELYNNLVAGVLGGTIGTLINTPADVVKSRIQNTIKVAGQTPKYTWTIPSAATILREEGPKALYAGLTPKLARLAPGGGILLVAVEFILDEWRKLL